MSKLSFRARALDPSKPMPIYLAEELPDLPEYSAINRAVPQMPSGMEKEEESVSFSTAFFSFGAAIFEKVLLVHTYSRPAPPPVMAVCVFVLFSALAPEFVRAVIFFQIPLHWRLQTVCRWRESQFFRLRSRIFRMPSLNSCLFAGTPSTAGHLCRPPDSNSRSQHH